MEKGENGKGHYYAVRSDRKWRRQEFGFKLLWYH
jgi:hypothetical protein